MDEINSGLKLSFKPGCRANGIHYNEIADDTCFTFTSLYSD